MLVVGVECVTCVGWWCGGVVVCVTCVGWWCGGVCVTVGRMRRMIRMTLNSRTLGTRPPPGLARHKNIYSI